MLKSKKEVAAIGYEVRRIIKMNKCDILVLEFASKSRDSNILTPVIIYLREEKKYSIKRTSLAYGVLKLLVYRPKMLLMANYLGAPENIRVFKYAQLIGIKTVSLISEGDVVDDPKRVLNYFWGWDFERKCYFDLFLLWSENSKRIFEKYIPECKNYNIKISGHTGFDRYKLLKKTFMTKEMFCVKYKKIYSKVIGITSWGFSKFFADKANDEKNKFYRKSCIELRKILYQIIQYFNDTLFILRPHPGEISGENEFLGLESLNNVIFIQGKDETISDNINVCDIWIAYDSTTCLEGWLLDKVTLLIHPFPISYPVSKIHDGSPIMSNAQEIISCIEEYYKSGKIVAFDNLEAKRKEIIQDVIGHSDGKNYVRAGQEIDLLMNSDLKRKKKITVDLAYEVAKDIIKWICHHSFIKKFRNIAHDNPYYFNWVWEECVDEEQMYYNAIYSNYTGNERYII